MAFGRTYNASNVDPNKGHIAIPAGDYDVQIAEIADKVSKTSGKDMIELVLRIVNGPCSGGKLYYYITDDQYADQKVYDIMTSCRRQVPQQITSNAFRGGLVGRVRVKVEQYNGQSRPSVDFWLRPKPGSAPAPAQPAQNLPPANPNDVPF